MDEHAKAEQVKVVLESFRDTFRKYGKEVFDDHRRDRLDKFRTQLQQQEPQVTKYILDILGDATLALGSFGVRHTLSRRDLLSTALLGGNNELPHNFHDYSAPVMSALNKALGALEAGLWPPKEPTPVLVIKDDELRERCFDLLNSPGNYDRVIREATTILEDRMRNKCPHEILSRLIPQSADQTGDNLVNKLFAPDDPVLSISSERHNRIAFHRILLGTISYLRNPYHHRLDPYTEWSWAWSTVGFVDRLLADIESCVVVQ